MSSSISMASGAERAGQSVGWKNVVILTAAAMVVFVLFDRVANWLGGGRGEWGIVVAAIVVAAVFVAERIVYKTNFRDAVQRLGLGAPNVRAVLVAVLIGILVIAVLPIYAAAANVPMTVNPSWLWLAIGMFAQHGIGEELLFRGFVFGHLREGRTFWRAVWLSMIPFVAAHILLFFTLPLPIAIMSMLLAVVTSIPLAYLYEKGNRTIWAPAILHAAIEAVKLVTYPEASYMMGAVSFMAGAAVIPFLAFLFPKKFYGDAA